jgi:restriction endonuclease Mrr
MPSKQFKELSRKLIQTIGYYIKSEPKFPGDDDYIDGNAINFYTVPIKNPKIKNDILITVRRYKEVVPELSVSRFMDWLEENGKTQGIFIASVSYSTQALKIIQSAPNVRFIDRVGLSKILGRIQ